MHKVPIDYTSIFIGQLDRTTDEKSVRERFGKYGTIIALQVLTKQSIVGRRPGDIAVTGFAFVKYDGRDAATRAVKAEVRFSILRFQTVSDLENGAVFEGRTIRVQYRELHQKLYQTRNPINMIPKLAPPPPRARPQQQQVHVHPVHKMPSTLGQLSGTGGLSSDGAGGFGGFDPVTGLANGMVRSSSPVPFTR